VDVTGSRERLSAPMLGTVLGGAAAALAAPRAPSLRLVSLDETGTGFPQSPSARSDSAGPSVQLHALIALPPARPRAVPVQPLVPAEVAKEDRQATLLSCRAEPSRPAELSRPAAPSRPAEPSRPAQPGSRREEPRPASAPRPAEASPEAAPPQPEPPLAQVAAQRELFRQAALEARDGVAAPLVEAAEPQAGSWGILALLLSLVAALFLGAGLLSVEVTVRAPGALRAPNGLRSVESVLSGAVTELLVQAGDEVAADQVVARLEETQLRATLTLREKELATLRHDTDEANAADAALLRQTTAAVEHQRTALSRRGGIHESQLRQRSQQLTNLRAMRESGVASGNDELSGEESVQAAAEQIALVGSQLAELNLSLADRRREWKQRELDRKSSLSRAVAAVEEAKSLLALTEVRSPAAGRVESLLVTPGAVVQPGRVIAQIVPNDAPRSIVAFLPSREVSFVSVGSQANVEIESLPVNEFGMAKAQVKRISTDIAKPEEMASAFGEVTPGSYVRVELDLLDDENHQKMAPHLRSGERVLVRLHRRHQRVLGLIFEFTRKWLGW
jgi:multidrug resistance efflux pump